MDNAGLPEILDPLLEYLSAHLPSQLYDVAETLLTNSYSLCSSLLTLVRTLLSNSPLQLDAQQILPPLITLLAAYLALVSFYRTAGWMVRTAFAFVKWGFILSTLGAAAGYFIANANAGGAGNGLGMFGDGLLPTLGGMLLGMFNPEQQNRAASNGRRGRTGAAAGRTRSKTQGKDRPKAWESWGKHKDWQYTEQAYHQADGGNGANVQEIIGDILGSAGRVVRESGWWEAAKSAASEFSKSAQGGDQDGQEEVKSSKTKGKSKSR